MVIITIYKKQRTKTTKERRGRAMTTRFINTIFEKVIFFRHTLLNGWAPIVVKFENQILVASIIIGAIGLLIFSNHNIPSRAVDSGKVTKEEMKYHRKMQVKGGIICGIAVILMVILGTACVKVENM